MITPGSYNFEVYRWGTLRKTFIWKPDGRLAILTGYSARIFFKDTPDSVDDVKVLEGNAGGAIVSETEGTVTMFIPLSDLSVFANKNYYFAIQLIEPAGDTLTWIEGVMTLINSNIRLPR